MSGKPKSAQSREMVVSVYEYFREENNCSGPLLPFTQVKARTAAALKINKNTVTKILKEKYGETRTENNVLRTPTKKGKCGRKKTVTGIDDFQKRAIQQHIYGYFMRNELPTVDKILVSLMEAGLFEGKSSSLKIVLKNIGFCYNKLDNRKIIVERTDIALWRCTFLREIKDLAWEKIIFTGETWINANHTVTKIGTDDSAAASTKSPLGKGERIILCHAGSVDGFVPNALLSFKSNNTGDHREEIDSETYLLWFETQLLPNIPPASIIIVDNASYHSVQVDKPPSTATRKVDIIEWLKRHGIPCGDNLRKPELLHLVKLNKPKATTYVVDEMARTKGHRVLRLPPYHRAYNAIELIWAQLKGHVAPNNTQWPFSANKVMQDSLETISADKWKAVIEHTKQKVIEDWEFHGLLDGRLEDLIIKTQDDSDSGSDSNSC